VSKSIAAIITLSLFGIAGAADAPSPLEPMRVCEILHDLNAYRGKVVPILGRYSYRTSGRFLSEEACESKLSSGGFDWPNTLKLELDSKEGPALPAQFDIDGAAADRKTKAMRKATALGKFRFGSLEYDRWAIVYGRVEPVRALEGAPPGLQRSKSGLEPAPATLVYRGDGMIFFIAGE
jgi:hypothetical protein